MIYLSKRIFFALNFPSEIKKELFEKCGKKLNLEGIKRVKEENIHITLLFLGYFDEEKIQEIKEKAAGIKQEKIRVKINGIDSFNFRVIFLRTEKGEKEIEGLHKKICSALEIRDERFKAHATIARNKKLDRKSFEGIMKKLKEIELEKEIEIKSFDLMESILSPEGPEYKKIFSVKLL